MGVLVTAVAFWLGRRRLAAVALICPGLTGLATTLLKPVIDRTIGLDEVRSAALEQFWGYVPRELKGRKTSMVVAAVPADLTQEEEEDLAQMVHLWVEQRRRRNS